MADTGTVHVNDAGVIFMFTVQDENGAAVNLSGAQNVMIQMQKPDRTVIQRDCEIIGDGTSGIIRYISQFDDFDQPGRWKMQAVVTFATDNVKHSNIPTLTVAKNIPL